MLNHYDVVIVGTGHAGAQAAIALRKEGFEGSVAIIGEETSPPYERPPLSKEYLLGTKPFERMMLRPVHFWTEKKIELLLGRSVTGVEPAQSSVLLDDDTQIRYEHLIWAGGGAARKLACEGVTLDGIHAVRTKDDSDQILADLGDSKRTVCIVGGGYIGLESAAVLRKLGHEVVLLESADRLLSRVAGEHISQFYLDQHRASGVDVRLNARLDTIVEDEGRVSAVQLGSGERIPCELMIVGIGIVPSIAPLEEAGGRVSNGVIVDKHCQTSLPGIYAIGDCARHSNSFAGGAHIRLESVQNANDMANVVAKTICGTPETYNACPWFWSNQYDLKLQTVGLSLGYDTEILRGDAETASFSVVYTKGGQVIALDCVNRAKDFVQGKKLVEQRAQISPSALSDSDTPLKELMAAVV